MPQILLVEDDQAIARNLVLLLRSKGFTVTTALRGVRLWVSLADIRLTWR